jgi:hypothetical protein
MVCVVVEGKRIEKTAALIVFPMLPMLELEKASTLEFDLEIKKWI